MIWAGRKNVRRGRSACRANEACSPHDELRPAALTAKPPEESGSFRKPELVELALLNPSIHLDIRYATANDFLGTPVYSQARAFLQRPAADALFRVQQKLKPLGYGLLIHDAYRRGTSRKIFWDATPPEGKIFVGARPIRWLPVARS